MIEQKHDKNVGLLSMNGDMIIWKYRKKTEHNYNQAEQI